MFRWLILEGIMITWQEKKFKIDTLDKAHELFEHHFMAEEDQESREKNRK